MHAPIPARNSSGRSSLIKTIEETAGANLPFLERGISDSFNPAVVIHEEVARAARIKGLLAELQARVAPIRVAIEIERSHVIREIEKYRDRIGHSSSPLLRSGLCWTTFGGLVLFEVVLAKPVMGLYGYGDAARTIAATGAVMTPAFLFDAAISRRHLPNTFFDLAVTRRVCGGAAIAVPLAVAAYRSFHLPVEAELHGGPLVRALEVAWIPATILIMLLAPVLTVTGAHFIEKGKQYYDEFKAGRLQRQADRMEVELAKLTEEETSEKARIEADGELQHAEYLRGVMKARAEETTENVALSFLRSLNWPTIVGGLALVVILALFISCTPMPANRTVFNVDRSGSTDRSIDNHMKGVWEVASRSSCTVLTVIPVNATVRDPFEVSFPCEDADGYGTEYRKVYEKIARELPLRMAQWAQDSNSNGSDYGGAFELSHRVLAHGKEKRMIVIGDLRQSGGNGEFKTIKGTPSLAGMNFNKTKLFLGFIESRGVGRSSSAYRSNWEKAFQNAGASPQDITSTPFGLEGLRDWCETNIGLVNPAYERFEAVRR